jgi:hypothetical protein
VVFYEGAKEILDAPHYDLLASAWEPDCFYIGLRCSAIHLHAFLTVSSQRLAMSGKEFEISDGRELREQTVNYRRQPKVA